MHPVLFEYGPLQIRFYGLMYVIAIVVGTYLIKAEARRKALGIKDDDITGLVVWAVISGILGARIYYVIFNWDYYSLYPREIPAIWHGGLAIHGGLIGGVVSAWYYLKRRGISFWRMADCSAPAIILGQAFGRFGNFMNGDAHGTPTTMPWGMVFPPQSIAGSEYPGIPIHPTMLYEMAINLGIFAFLWFYLRKRTYRDGFVFAVYIVMYSTGRFFVEFFRADSLMLGPLRTAQVVSLALVVIVLAIVINKRLWEGDSL